MLYDPDMLVGCGGYFDGIHNEVFLCWFGVWANKNGGVVFQTDCG